ncbi:hypothetical protein O181_107756 [Austropuccinia psidii MF-1]|uniref:Uncharacterized protein n=1 Tax=Austropuccinia psidii MF-1 TaxID=1389203 RepID=A0A9Q3PPE6_9BASI|nr:hypothetical protein [Austropuccinia psidii MF-1]
MLEGPSQLVVGQFIPFQNSPSQGVVKRIIQIANTPPDRDAEGSDDLDGEEVEVGLNYSGHNFSTSPSQPAAKIFQSQLVPIPPRNFQPVLPIIPHHSPSRSLVPTIRPSPITQPRNSPIFTYQKTPTCGQLQYTKRRPISFAISCCQHVSAKGTMAYPGYRRG